MRRNTINFMVDLAAFLCMLGMIATGLVVRFLLPAGTGGRLSIWGLGRHDWGGLHFYLSLGLLFLILVHLVLHWTWTVNVARKLLESSGLVHQGESGATTRRARRRVAMGVSALLMTLGGVGGFYAWAAANVTVNEYGRVRRGAGEPTEKRAATDREVEADRRANLIRGSTSLQQAADVAGVTVERLKQALGLPQDMSGDARLGRLAKRHDLDIREIRVIVAQLAESAATESS